ncbi:MAG: LysR family transcriptional regulator substrate-binding protein, partial [Eubacterium sp.]|nr:LysR family transcriptional regulator substrate-binding protein [Eubacterium sp.]
ALLEEKYKTQADVKQEFSVSTQHYSFAVNAFVDLIKEYGSENYDFSLRETQTYEIIDDVAKMRSEIGILYYNNFNKTVLEKILKANDLEFSELFVAKPHIFVSTKNPLAKKKSVTMEELIPFPYLSFEQGEHNSFYFSEEIFSTVNHSKNIRVRDRATLFNLLIGLNGYTVCSGVIDEELNGESIIAVPLNEEGEMHIGYITHKNALPTRLGEIYINALKNYTKQY